MSYTHTFFVSQALKGANATHKVYKMDLVPTTTSTTLYGAHVRSCTSARLVSAKGTLFVIQQASDKASPFATAAIVDKANTANSVHGLANGGGFAFGNQTYEFDLSQSIGIDPIIKGVALAGGKPALHIAVASSWDTSSIDVAFFSMRFEVEFSGISDTVAFDGALPAAT